MRLIRMLFALCLSLLLVTPAQATFTTYNESLPGGPSLFFATDAQIIANATQGQGWSSGGVLTAQSTPDMTVALTAGTGANGQAGTTFITWAAQATMTIAAADPDWPRIDLISVPFNSATPTPVVTTGVAYAAPVPPDLPVTSSIQNLGLWYVIVPAGVTAITGDLLMDKRMVIGASVLIGLDTGALSALALRSALPKIQFLHQNGTLSVPTATSTSDPIGTLNFARYTGSAFATSSTIRGVNTTGDAGRLEYASAEHRFDSFGGGAAPRINAQSGAYAVEVANEGSTGTSVNRLAKPTGAPSTAIITTTADTTGLLGIVVAGAGTTGNAQIARLGTASCVFDGPTTANYYVTASTTSGGQCTSFGASPPTDGSTIIGRVLSTNGAGGTYSVLVQPAISSSSTSPISVLALASDATANSTTTGVEIAGLNKTTGTGTFTFKYVVRYQSAATTTGVKFGVNHTVTTTVFLANLRLQVSSGSQTTANQAQAATVNPSGSSTRLKSTTAPDLGPSGAVDTANADMLAIIEGLIIVTGTGDLELWHASEVAAASTVMAGSSLILTKTSP